MYIKILLLTVYLSFFTSFLPSYADFKNLIPNPSLEEDKDMDGLPDFWEMEGGVKWEKKGCYGKRSVSIFGKGVLKCKIEGIKPNKYYLLSFFVKRDGFRDGEYPYMKIFNQKFYLNELFSFGGWVKLSWLLKSENEGVTDFFLINPGMTHKLWFDCISLIEFSIRPISPLGGKAINGDLVNFMWEIPRTDHILDIEIEVSRDEGFKRKRIIRIASPKGNYCQIKGLNKGKWYWRIGVFKNRKRIFMSKIQTFTVLNESTKPLLKPINKVDTINLNNFFPIGIYGARIEAFSELKEAGFNSVQCYSRDLDTIEKFIKNAKRYGLKALICIPKEAWERDVSSFFSRVRDLESILAWYLEDEPEGRGVAPSYIWRLRDYIFKMDSRHPTALVIVRSKKAWDYGPAADILMIDTYPIPMMPLTWLSDSIDEARRAVFYEKPIWAVVQAFDWSKSRLYGRNPTYEEERCLTYLSIVHGASGIFYYTFKSKNYYIKDYPKHWLDIKRIVKELNKVYPLLLAKDALDISISSNNKSIHHLTKFVDKGLISKYGKGMIKEGYYLIAVNADPISVVAEFRTNYFSKARVLFEERDIIIKDGKFTDYFGPYCVHIYSLK